MGKEKERGVSMGLGEEVPGTMLIYLQGSQPHAVPLPRAKSRPSQRRLLGRAVLGSGPATLFSQMGTGGLGGGCLSQLPGRRDSHQPPPRRQVGKEGSPVPSYRTPLLGVTVTLLFSPGATQMQLIVPAARMFKEAELYPQQVRGRAFCK